ncbi:MAG: hypothetical protein NTZ92_05235 [Candidatus Omnitrophica bacterium]|nr:hypothetical protein [Candidatus Omnitrophota bacterium]
MDFNSLRLSADAAEAEKAKEQINQERVGDIMQIKKLYYSVCLIFAFFVIFMTALFADTVVLKSGKTVEGKIIEKTNKYVKIDFQGVELTYFVDEIEKIESDGAELKKTDENKDVVLSIIRDAAEYIKIGQLDKVEEVYKDGLKEFPNSALLWASLAGNTLDRGRSDEAIEYCNRALSFDSCSAQAYFILGLVSAKKGDEDKAIQKFQGAIKCDPSFDLAYYDLGISYFSKKMFSEAVDMWVKATQLDKESSMGKRIENTINRNIQNASPSTMIIQKSDSSKPWILLPPLEISQKKVFEGLLLEYKTKLQITGTPDFTYYMNLGGINYYYRGDFDKGLEETKMALSTLINNNDLPEAEKQKHLNYIYRILGDIYLQKMEFELAEQSYHEALKFISKDTNSLCGLGIVNTIKGDFSKAREIYKEVLALNPKSTFAQEALKRLGNK